MPRTRQPSSRSTKKTKAKAKSKAKSKLTTYTAKVSIAGYVFASQFEQRISTNNGNVRRHAVFNLAKIGSTFPPAFQEVAAASDNFYTYQYQIKPTTLEVAKRYVADRLGSGWTVSAPIGSCWTSTGWRPPPAGVTCDAHELKLTGSAQPSISLARFEGGLLFLRFAVAVEITP